MTASRDAAYFDRLYAASEDPWNFRSSRYERDKYATTLAALGGRGFAAALEVGCSIGELTWRLADRCQAVLGIDIAAAPLAAAARHVAGRPGLRFQQMAVPDEFPAGQFDLIVLSEILYFLSPDDVAALAARIRRAATDTVLLVNWRGLIDEPCQGDASAEIFVAAMAPGWVTDLKQNHGTYRIDRLRRAAAMNILDVEKKQESAQPA